MSTTTTLPRPANRPSARDRLLAAADELFYEEGVHTVGIDRIIERAGVAKATLYSTFGSKDGLVRAYLEARHDAAQGADHPRPGPVQHARASGCSGCSTSSASCSPSRAIAAARSSTPARSRCPGARPSRSRMPTARWTRALFLRLATEAGVGRPGHPGSPAPAAVRRRDDVGPDGPRPRCGGRRQGGRCRCCWTQRSEPTRRTGRDESLLSADPGVDGDEDVVPIPHAQAPVLRRGIGRRTTPRLCWPALAAALALAGRVVHQEAEVRQGPALDVDDDVGRADA